VLGAGAADALIAAGMQLASAPDVRALVALARPR